jgi:hypothetical protein
MNRRRIAIATLAAGLFVSCAHVAANSNASGPSGPNDAAAYYPLKIGQQWNYEAQLLGEKHDLVVQITKEQDGYYVDSQGGQIQATSLGIRDRERYLIKNPVQEGQTWGNILSPDSQERYRIESAGAPCEVPAGHFQPCIVVVGRTLVGVQQDALVNRMTFARGIGLVRSEVLLERGGSQTLQSRLELKSYR